MERVIFQLINKETLADALSSFYECIHIPIRLLDENGVTLLSYGGMIEYCQFIQKFLRPGQTCAQFHQKAAAKAMQIGEAYTCTCHSDLNHIVYPIVSDDSLLGSVLMGPFLMESPDTSMMGAVASHYHMDMHDALTLYETATSISVLEPRMVNHLNHLLFHLLSNITKPENEYLRISRGKNRQQSEISNVIRNYKSGQKIEMAPYPYEKEQLLVRKVRSGNLKEAKAVLNDLLGYVLLTNAYSLTGAKARSMELCTILSRTVIEAGADENRIMELSTSFLVKLNEINDLDSLCFHLQELVESYINLLFPDEKKVESDVIQSAISYIQQNFRTELRLCDVASHVYLNPAYFSSLFKQAAGCSFKDYLTNLRIEEARSLLVKTNMSIVDIAMSCGFSSQSYFSRVFREKTGFSPKSFRS